MNPNQKLSPYEVSDIWGQIEAISKLITNVAKKQNILTLYKHMDNLDLLRRRLQAHYIALELEKNKNDDGIEKQDHSEG